MDLPSYERIALVLQGGGALGAYQAGVYQGLYEAGIQPNHISGISIGALNTAVIAGNAPEHRVEKLRKFWETICQPNLGISMLPFLEHGLFNLNDWFKVGLSNLYGLSAIVDGQNGFYKPRFPPPLMMGNGNPAEASYYDTSALKSTLEKFCDFDRMNSKKCDMHVSVGAVNIRKGNFVYFDNECHTLRPEHFIASGALPPAFAPVEIDGDYYWDGGIVSNTPLTYVLGAKPSKDTLVFQVDLWSARGHVPQNMEQVNDRQKEIQYSSRTRMLTDYWKQVQEMRHVIGTLLESVPADKFPDDGLLARAKELADRHKYNVIQLIYRDRPYESHNKDYQFGLATMNDHWQSGLLDIRETLEQPNFLAMPDNEIGFVSHDVHRDEVYVPKAGKTK
ncbi:MAG: patatin-like phospholipase family protein [Alcaligenaceae bacterium]|nr:patatin-like phospholipase family protein [Alcaligenaceae bacterium]